MTNPLDVLLLESEPGAADEAADALAAAGHTVRRCHEAGARAFPCRSLADDDCPLDAGTVDVALTVRARPRSIPGALEDGVTCALQHRVPLVVAGRVGLNPFDEWATEVVDGRGDVVQAVETAAHGSLRQHALLAIEAARNVLATRGLTDPEVHASAHRRRGVVRVAVVVPADVDRTTRDMVATRAHSAIRAYDRHARQIDLAVDNAPA
jgi:hypothetical protein